MPERKAKTEVQIQEICLRIRMKQGQGGRRTDKTSTPRQGVEWTSTPHPFGWAAVRSQGTSAECWQDGSGVNEVTIMSIYRQTKTLNTGTSYVNSGFIEVASEYSISSLVFPIWFALVYKNLSSLIRSFAMKEHQLTYQYQTNSLMTVKKICERFAESMY